MDTEKSSEVVRAARRELHGKIRNDWDEALVRIVPSIPESYLPHQLRPEFPEPQSLDSGQQYGDRRRFPFRNSASVENEPVGENPYSFLDSFDTAGGDAIDWRERTYAPSDPSSAEDSDNYVPGVDGIFRKLGLGNKDQKLLSRNTDASKPNDAAVDDFSASVKTAEEPSENHDDQETPDPEDEVDWSSLSKEEKKKLLRTKRRRKRQHEEMEWNSGLRYWELRRDIWCCAKPRRITSPTSPSQSQTEMDTSSQQQMQQTYPEPIEQPDQSQSLAPHPRPTKPIPTMTLPVAPTLLQTTQHKRATISPAAFPSIYNKLVTQSLSPSVPLNLSAVVPALVEGWKANGEWPTGTPADTTLSVNLTAGTQEKRSSTHGSSFTAIADATKSGLRALGGKATANGTSRKPDIMLGLANKTKHRLKTSQDVAPNLQQDLHSREPKKTTQTTSKSKAIVIATHNRTSSTSTPDSFAPQAAQARPTAETRADDDLAGTAPGSGGTGSTSGSTNETSSPRRVRKGVARVGKAIRDGFIVSPASADGVGS